MRGVRASVCVCVFGPFAELPRRALGERSLCLGAARAAAPPVRVRRKSTANLLLAGVMKHSREMLSFIQTEHSSNQNKAEEEEEEEEEEEDEEEE